MKKSLRPLTGQTYQSGRSSIAATAALSVVVLVAALAWQISATLSEKNKASYAVRQSPSDSGSEVGSYSLGAGGDAASSLSGANDLSRIGTDMLEQLVGSYVDLKKSGLYTPAAGERIASNVASSLNAPVSYAAISETSIKTDPDVSYRRMLAYRSDMRVAFGPLLENDEAEFAIFARYVETGDKSNLVKLGAAAERYKKAAANARNVAVPKDSVAYHVKIVNSLLKFAATLEQMAAYADDPMASLALLRTYNSAEADVFTSFNALAQYQKNKTS
ncbi:MAG: hypothetical protein Q7S05_04050 [bacterium]|nr:hypothetical protein [bacterium]